MSRNNRGRSLPDMYLSFRQELDRICVPEILKIVDTTKIMHEGNVVGILCANPDYIDCIYILPEYRRRGLARKAVLNFWENNPYKHDVRLHIIRKNKPALRFWKGIFELELLEGNESDDLYRILKVKQGSAR